MRSCRSSQSLVDARYVVKLLLNVAYPDTYPDVLPDLFLDVEEGDLEPDELASLIDELKVKVLCNGRA